MVAIDPDLPEIDNYRSLFTEDAPLLDVRAPIEFEEGAIPCATNIPLVDNEERHLIGIAYKEQGQGAAIALGERLVSGQTREQRIAAWRAFVEQHPNGVLYCFRGGMRSKISQQWLSEAGGLRIPRVKGGYKALRRFLIEELERLAGALTPVVLGGRTGCGKTRFLRTASPMADLEHLAWHRGSAFGRHATPQPTQIDFENHLAADLIRIEDSGRTQFLVEDESRNVGGRHVPPVLFERMAAAPLVVLEVDDEYRVTVTLQEYVHDALAEYRSLHGEEAGFDRWSEYLVDSVDRIRKRLGGERHARIRGHLLDALEIHRARGDTEPHRAWISALLHDYYDAMYSYQLSGKQARVVFSGDHAAVREYLADHHDMQFA